ncbi:Orm1-like membrane protein [Encephalitozoon intestinalis ATCC 50506]|uniref:Orm1-like membrane protein n=1 Tax=Encephalitozoon intestinalis (strain ATCC 50506) TaxID=876142 RepID=E0S9Y1_ENCIT|nr:Orm1-like membrane protein [Encephalitozoon intestinalis ATCC 50506]ADM12603.1 Orm1-like membrane protein [Encephalitozoon intestinalis ATCC 50506]UTX46460.1 Orm1-like membrane protein [Encephalitozoon intestinalis]
MGSKNKGRKVDVSQNVAWTLQRGSWIIHVLVILLLKMTLSVVFNDSIGWQLSLIIYNISTFVFFHMIPGDPFNDRYSLYTFWEQISEQLEGTPDLIFIALFPLIAFTAVNFIIRWNIFLFWICVASLFIVTIPKFGFMHLRRILIFKE